jgi:hypothetical protein
MRNDFLTAKITNETGARAVLLRKRSGRPQLVTRDDPSDHAWPMAVGQKPTSISRWTGAWLCQTDQDESYEYHAACHRQPIPGAEPGVLLVIRRYQRIDVIDVPLHRNQHQR